MFVMNNKYWEVYIGTGTILAKYIVFDMFRPLFWDGQKYREKLKTIKFSKSSRRDVFGPLLMGWPKRMYLFIFDRLLAAYI